MLWRRRRLWTRGCSSKRIGESKCQTALVLKGPKPTPKNTGLCSCNSSILPTLHCNPLHSTREGRIKHLLHTRPPPISTYSHSPTHSLTHPSKTPPPKEEKKAAQTISDPIRTRAGVNSPNLAIRTTTRTRRRTMMMMSLLFLCILEKREKKTPPGQGWNLSFFFFFGGHNGVSLWLCVPSFFSFSYFFF